MTDFRNLVRIELYIIYSLSYQKTLDPPPNFVIIVIQTITFSAVHRVDMMGLEELIIFLDTIKQFLKMCFIV